MKAKEKRKKFYIDGEIFILLTMVLGTVGLFFMRDLINYEKRTEDECINYTIENGINFEGIVIEKSFQNMGRSGPYRPLIKVKVLSPSELKDVEFTTYEDYRVDEVIKGKYANIKDKDWWVIEDLVK